MANYLLVSFKTCPWVQRAAIVLREKNIDFEFRHIEPDNRPDWFLAISPHKKVPVLRIDDSVSLFESNAIAEYLDETIAPRLHPADPVARAVNRAWTDYVPDFAGAVTATAYADSEADYNKAAAKIPGAFERLEQALEKQGRGPYFNGTSYSLVDAAYAPFLQRYYFLDRVKPLGRDREVSAAKGLERRAAGAAIHPFVRACRVRGDVSGQLAAPQQVGVAVRGAYAGRGGIAERQGHSEQLLRICHPSSVICLAFGNCPISILAAAITAWVRLSTPSFCRMAETCAFTVASDTPSS